MQGFIIDVDNCKVGSVDIADNDHLGEFYRLIGCRCIDITVRRVGGKPYNVVLDDEGLLVQNPIVSACEPNGRGMLAGNLILFNMDEDTMDLAPITQEDADLIASFVRGAVDIRREVLYPVLVMEY